MEGVMPQQLEVWLDRSPRRPEDSYLRKAPKIVRCRNEQAHAPSYRRKIEESRAHRHRYQSPLAQWAAAFEEAEARQIADAHVTGTEAKFRKLAREWSRETSNVSSVGVLTSHPKYREIVRLGWDVVPFLLADLQRSQGFWFTALNEITGIRPFDPSEGGNSRRMAEAWINWGKRKGII